MYIAITRDGIDLAVGEAVATRRGVEASAASVVFAFGSACIFAGGVGGVAQPMIGTAQVPAGVCLNGAHLCPHISCTRI